MPDPNSPDDYAVAFRLWMSTRIQLAHAIQEYLEATIALSAAFLVPPSQPSSRRSFDHMLVQIDQQLPSTLLDEQKLQLTHSKLGMVRNMSWPLVPINALPEEILSTVFKLAVRPCLMNSRDKTTLVAPTVLSSVCSSWRQISFSTHSLWSHIDINPTEPVGGPCYRRAGLWTTRSQSAHLYIHASNDGVPESTRPSATAQEFVNFLRPLIPRMVSLEMGLLDGAFQDHLLGAISSWVRDGSHGSARQLELGRSGANYSNELTAQDLRTQLLSTNDQVTSSEFESFFQSIGTLHLIWLVPPPLDSTIYHGLTELRIEGPGSQTPHPQRQLAAVLTACPKLRALTLLHFEQVSDPDFSPIPVALNDLKTLALDHWNRVLPLITSSSPSIDMSICVPSQDYPNFVADVRAFFARCKVTRLYVGTPFIRDYLATWLGHIPHVRTLALDFFEVSNDTLRDYINTYGTEFSFSDPWPRLQCLILRSCMVSQVCVQRLVSMHPLQELHIVAAVRFPLWGTVEENGQFADRLRASIPRVVFTDNYAEDPTNEWDFVYSVQRR